MWAGLTAAFQLAVQLMQVILPVIADIRELIAKIKANIEANNKRIADAVAEAEAAKKAALDKQIQRETSNVAAFHQIVEQAWQIRYNQILPLIQNKQYDKVLVLRLSVDDPIVDNVLFDESMSAEYRAMKIVQIMRATPTK